MAKDHVCKPPKSNDFEEAASSGCWLENDLHYVQVVGNSGIYLVVTDTMTGKVVRDDRPWQMKEGLT